MNNDMTGLLNLAYEIEGLLLLHINRGDEATADMTELLVGKAEKLLAGLKSDCEPVVEPLEEVAAPEEAVVAAEPVAVAAEEPLDAVPAAEAEEIAESAQFEEAEDATSSVQPSLTLDEKLARERAADISKAFTLNDKFRFRRELFRNSEEEFKETLDVIGSMADMDEAEDYFYNDLCWDSDKDEVKEFMAIVAKHF